MKKKIGIYVLFLFLVLVSFSTGEAATQAMISGEIQRITINDPNDHWSGGIIVIDGESVIIPKNLLIDLPANRLTLKQIFDQAPLACQASGLGGTKETGLAKNDICNLSGAGGFATISANRVTNGSVIAGDVFIEKGREVVIGTITYINNAEGYFKLNGDPFGLTGVMVRLNDPTGRHTVQAGLGCAPGSALANCSPDPRFTLDPDNYTNVFTTGYPLCIPKVAGAIDPFCPSTNRTVTPFGVDEPPVADSTRFAPILVGDSIAVEGNYETINAVQFLSAHTSMVFKAMTTRAGQPDYFFLDEVEIDAPGFQNQRARTLFIGYATQAVPIVGADILIWTLHRDPVNNEIHEFPLASVRGCDNAAGAGTCGVQGLGGAGNNIFKIRHDVDFTVATDAKLDPCAHLRADTRLASLNICPSFDGTGTNIAEQFAILSPIPHEIMARTGQKLADLAALPAQKLPPVLDVQGNPAPWGQYLFPLGMNLGGVSIPEMNEINLNLLATPFIFEGIPWNLDRRLSPGGCIDTTVPPDGIPDCGLAPQPLDPFPFSGLDPRTQALTPITNYNDPNYTASTLTSARNRIISFVDAAIGNFNGDLTLLNLGLAIDPPALPLVLTDSSIIWRNAVTGENAIWLMNGTTFGSAVALQSVADLNWKIVGAGDFNADSQKDILWRNVATGDIFVWLMNGTTFSSGVFIGTVADPNWEIVEVKDLDGNTTPDILWRNVATGDVFVWLMNGTAFSSGVLIGAVADPNWKIVGAADFSADGQADILWQNAATGEIAAWLMNGMAFSSTVLIGTVADLNLKIVGVADFNANGQADILWHHAVTGEIVVWLMNGSTLTGAAPLGAVADLNWKIVIP